MQYIQRFILAAVATFLLWSCGEDYTEDFPVPDPSLVAKFSVVNEQPYVTGDSIYFKNVSVVPERFGEASYSWDFNGEQSAASANPVHVFPTEGSYQVMLTVTTSSGDSATYSESLSLKNLLIGDTLLQENFSDLQYIPESWELANIDGNEPASAFSETFADSAWAVRYSSVFGSNVATAVSYYDPEAEADDWMIMSKVALGDNTVLRWDALSFTSSGEYPDDYEVYVSTTNQTVEGCKAHGALIRIDDEAWRTSAEVPGEGIQNRRLYLSEQGFKNQEVYVAFRLMTPSPGGSSLGIDNIAIIDIQ